LPCRDTEHDRVIAHLRTAVKRGGSEQVLYISGMPGTGKTAVVLETIKQLKAEASGPRFEFVHVNAMRLGAPKAVFGEIWRQLPNVPPCPMSSAYGELQRFFSGRRQTDPVVILLIDEIDHLVTSNQAVLYSVFEWLGIPGARLAIAAISNTMDLPERMLPRVASRFEVVRVDFWPYTRDQIQKVLCERLRLHDATQVFAPVAIKFCAAKVAAGSGDVRKALQLCRRAVEALQCETNPPPDATGMVEMRHVQSAIKDLLHANPSTIVISGLSCKTRRFLVAFLLELRGNGDVDVAPLRRVAARYEKLVGPIGRDGTAPLCSTPSSGSHAEDAAMIADRLEAMNLIKQQGKELARAGGSGGGASRAGPGLVLGAGVDIEDLGNALLNVEEDSGIREILRD